MKTQKLVHPTEKNSCDMHRSKNGCPTFGVERLDKPIMFATDLGVDMVVSEEMPQVAFAELSVSSETIGKSKVLAVDKVLETGKDEGHVVLLT